MTLHVSDFIPGLLEDTDKYIEAADGYYVTVMLNRVLSPSVLDPK